MSRNIVTVLLSLGLFSTSVWAYSGGTGEPNDPYQIATAEDLIDLGNDPCNYDKQFILTADINLFGYAFNRAVIAPDIDDDLFRDYEYQGTPFSGSFDGQNHIISNLTIYGRGYLGLFGYLAEEAVVSNLGLQAVRFTGTEDWIGGLAGANLGCIALSYCMGSVSGIESLGGSRHVGGLVGLNGGSIAMCYSNGSVSGAQATGGLVGSNHGSITSSYSTGSANGMGYIGGLVGHNWSGSVISCYATGPVSGGGIGGLVGYNEGSIASSYSTGSVGSSPWQGCGLVGQNKYWTDNIKSSFWDIETSGQWESDGGIGLTTAQMQEMITFQDAGWDFAGETTHGICDYWLEQEGDYPRLAFLNGATPAEPNGSGTEDNPYQLNDAHDLATVWIRPWACYRLDSDIDLSGITWNSTIIPAFLGQFDGNAHVIRNLHIEGEGNLGLFGYLAPKATVFDLGLEAVDINGLADCVGGLVGINRGAIESTYTTGSVKGLSYIGGLVGQNYGDITISHSSCSVSEGSSSGGLVGDNLGYITTSYSNGPVGEIVSYGGGRGVPGGSAISTGYGDGGGLVGRNLEGMGMITSSFWDTETSGQGESEGGTGLPTAQMQAWDAFLNAGWDFVDESQNGTNDDWFIPTDNYPTLAWYQDRYTAIPDVNGLTEQEAQEALVSQGFHVIMTYQFSDTIPDRQVISQDLEPGIEHQPGTSVVLTVALTMDGSGTFDDPYQISNPRQLILIGESPDYYDKHFIMTTDIDLSGHTFDRAVIAPDEDDERDGYQGTSFSGNFNGQGYSIRNINIQGSHYLGLFGQLHWNSEITNLGLEEVNIHGTGDFVGGLVGNNEGSITTSYGTGEVSADFCVGGLVGCNYGFIMTSYSTGKVSGDYRVGGLAGYNQGAIVELSYSTDSVSGNRGVGGFVGENWGDITLSYGTGSASGIRGIGGLVGYNHGSMTLSYSTGSVSGDTNIGGLVGGSYDGDIALSYSTSSVSGTENVGGLVGKNSSSDISLSYSSGSASGHNNVGGLVGENSNFSSITSCYSTGSVSGENNVGGLVGINDDTITSSFWNIETSGQNESAGGTGLSTAQMQDIQTFLIAGWDLAGETTNGTEDAWVVPAGNTPRLTWTQSQYAVPDVVGLTEEEAIQALYDQGFNAIIEYRINNSLPEGTIVSQGYEPGIEIYQGIAVPMVTSVMIEGAGSVEDPYQITTPQDLIALRNEPNDFDKHFILTTDIDLSSYRFEQAIIAPVSYNGSGGRVSFKGEPFSGSFNGNGHVINGLSIQGSDCLGLFGAVDEGAVISNLGLEAVDVNGTDYLGGLVGINSGNIQSCYITGSVRGLEDSIGGLVGYNDDGMITSSCSDAWVSGENRVGGLVGGNNGTITLSYNTGSVNGHQFIGGLVGTNVETITSSYSTGSVSGTRDVGGLVGDNESGRSSGTTTSSFWNTETSGQNTSDGGTGLPTAEMQDINTFLNAGWDFAEETTNGTDDTWWMPVSDYPRLWWEE